jgi:hypothetical protein
VPAAPAAEPAAPAAPVEEKTSASVPVKYYEASDIMVRESTALLIALALLVIIPVGCVVTGMVIWGKRRKR